MGFDHDSMNIHYSSIHHVLDDDDYDEEVMEDHSHRHLSRLSRCTSNSKSSPPTDDEEDELELGMSALSMDDGEDADAELSDKGEEVGSSALSSDSYSKEPRCYSLPATPPRRRSRRHGGGFLNLNQTWILKEYASENDAQLNKGTMRNSNQSHSRRQRRSSSSSSISFRERWMETAWWGNKKKYQGSAMDEEGEIVNDNNNNNSGESESLVITSRPKGGKKSLCMDLEEVKACKDLGFDLEHEMVELPGRISMPCSTNENSSGGNSPNANWRISSPGDDPRDVKARLKVWAQAVAIASTSRHAIS